MSSPTLRLARLHPRRPSGFTLVEVTLAIGIAGFAFIAILGRGRPGRLAFLGARAAAFSQSGK